MTMPKCAEQGFLSFLLPVDCIAKFTLRYHNVGFRHLNVSIDSASILRYYLQALWRWPSGRRSSLKDLDRIIGGRER